MLLFLVKMAHPRLLCGEVTPPPRMSVKLSFPLVRFEKKHCFVLVVLNWFPVCFYKATRKSRIIDVIRVEI